MEPSCAIFKPDKKVAVLNIFELLFVSIKSLANYEMNFDNISLQSAQCFLLNLTIIGTSWFFFLLQIYISGMNYLL